MKTTNKNFLYNILYQALAIVFPLIITPYISRILGVENIGIYSYTYSIVCYFMLFALLGINNYGTREISKAIDKSQKFTSIYLLQLILSFISIILYIIFIFVADNEYKLVLTIQGIFLLSVIFDINWFFFGIEEFKLAISRNIIIKILSTISIFILVKTENDLILYIIIMSVSTFISQIYMWLHLKRYIKFVKVNLFDIYIHLKPVLILFIPTIAYSIYRIMDKIMIGSITTTIDLSNYDSAEKIVTIPIMIVVAIGTVMLPYMSKVSKKELKEKITQNFKMTFTFVLPLAFGLFVIANDFTIVFFGPEFTKTADIIRLIIPTILFSAIASTVRNSYLIPHNKETIYVTATIIGAVINLILNLILINLYGVYGACIGTLSTEAVIMLYQTIKTRKEVNYKKMLKDLIITIIKGSIMAISIYLIGLLISNVYAKLISQILLGIIIYFSLNYKYIMYEFFNKEGK